MTLSFVTFSCNTVQVDGTLLEEIPTENDPLLTEIRKVLFERKEPSLNIRNLQIYDIRGNKVDFKNEVNSRSEEPYFFTFGKDKEPQISCCEVDVLGWNEYDYTQWWILGYTTEHYSGGVPENEYYREFALRKYSNGVLEPALPWAHGHWNSHKTDCLDDEVLFYGWAIPPNWLEIGTYNLEVSIGWDFPTYSVQCAIDDKDVIYGWPF